jgi:ribosomal protein L37E
MVLSEVTLLLFIFKEEASIYYRYLLVMRLFGWKPKGKMYSQRCGQCGQGFLSSYQLEAPICGKCLQKAKSLDSTVEHEKQCARCGSQGVIYGKQYCYSCYFGFGEQSRSDKKKVQREDV